ncbi:MAG: phosphoribosylglycinamide formyltransferase [Bacteroidota bacterium]|nr:phosphoribosylglycinamide formyltransferase [Bacteroidota bacterium]
MINAAIFASGEGTNADNLITYFKNDTRIKIKLVITNRDDAGVIKKAEDHKKTVQIISKEALNNYTDQIIEFLRGEKIDLIILAGFLLKIPEKLVKAFPDKIVNIHPALLPNYGGKGMYGIKVHEAVIANKDKESGISIHFVNEEYDKGAIILQVKCAINENDTAESLAQKIHALEYEHFPKAIEKLL